MQYGPDNYPRITRRSRGWWERQRFRFIFAGTLAIAIVSLFGVCVVVFSEGSVSFVGSNQTNLELRVHGIFWPDQTEEFPYEVGDNLDGEFGNFHKYENLKSLGYITLAPNETLETFFVYHGFSNRSISKDDKHFVFLAVDSTNQVLFRSDHLLGDLGKELPEVLPIITIVDQRIR